MSKVLFYTHDKEDLIKSIRLVINEIRQTELIDHKMNSQDEKISQKKTANLLGVSVPTLIDWRKKGKIPKDCYMRIGRPIYYFKKKLLAYAKENPDFLNPSRS